MLKATLPQNGRRETGEAGAAMDASSPVGRELGLGSKGSIRFLAISNVPGDPGQLILSLPFLAFLT